MTRAAGRYIGHLPYLGHLAYLRNARLPLSMLEALRGSKHFDRNSEAQAEQGFVLTRTPTRPRFVPLNLCSTSASRRCHTYESMRSTNGST
jgi:hypothetical protein